MRLINAKKLQFHGVVEFQYWPEETTPKYAILSHRWEKDEVTYQELTDHKQFREERTEWKRGYAKIRAAADRAVDYECEWLWCDTCCIDKTSSAELSEAINSMYRWYERAFMCFAYLYDVPTNQTVQFAKSEWFERAWTLQELIAPRKLIFFDNQWKYMDNKHNLAREIAARTRIDKDVLTGSRRLEKFTVAQKMSWAANRIATRTEDIAYSLLGIFDVNMPMLYGEGKKAFVRLQEEIIRRNADQTTFIWSPDVERKDASDTLNTDLFASHPSAFEQCGVLQMQNQKKKAFAVNNLGLDIEMTLRPTGLNSYLAYMAVESGGPGRLATLNLEIDQETGYLCRTGASLKRANERTGPQIRQTKRVTILRSGTARYLEDTPSLFGFHLTSENNNLSAINSWDPIQEWDCGQWSYTGAARNTVKFSIPDGASASIAMLKMTIKTKIFLIQLAYDINFNPCVNVSEFNTEFHDRFRRRGAWNEKGDMQFEWPDLPEKNWAPNLRHVDMRFEDPNTRRPCWCAKATDRQEFSAIIPTQITKPHINIGIKFETIPPPGPGPSTPNLQTSLPAHQPQARSPALSPSPLSHQRTHSRQPSYTPQPRKEWQFSITNCPPSTATGTSLTQGPSIEIIDIKEELEKQRSLMDIDEDEPSNFLRQSSWKDLEEDVKRRRGPLAARFAGQRIDTSPT